MHLRKVVLAQGKVKDAQAEIKQEKAVEKVEKLFSRFSKDTIEDHLTELGDTLEDAVSVFFKRQIEKSPDDINADDLLKELIKHFNNVVRAHRELSAKQ
jgi:mevalonate kinase